jgi:hypothetical protein
MPDGERRGGVLLFDPLDVPAELRERFVPE